MAIDFPNSPTNGQEFTSGSTTWVYDGSKWGLKGSAATSNDSMPVGSIMWFAGSSTPPGWIAANGSAVSRSTYATLFAAISTTYGAGDGSTTFNVPSVAATTGAYYIRYTTALGTQTTTSLSTAPVGTMIDWPVTSSYPTGWLRADGSAVSRVSYADLFTLLGTTYGSGDGSTTFNLPNMIQSGTGSPVTIIKASLGGIVEPSTVAHAASHTQGGSDVVSVTLNQVPNFQTNRNIIINGAAVVDQRNAGASVTSVGVTSIDRWGISTSSGTITRQQDTSVVPPGFSHSLKHSITAGAYSPTTTQSTYIYQAIEGYNAARLAYGTANALDVTVSFWVRSSVTGTYGVSLQQSGTSQAIVRTFTINAANTWEYKTLTFAGNTTGTWAITNSAHSYLSFALSAGTSFQTTAGVWGATGGLTTSSQTQWTNTLNATFYLSGVQLEAGSVATPFEFEPFETTLRKCQRYYEKSYDIGTTPGTVTEVGAVRHSGSSNALGRIYVPIRFKVSKRSGTYTTTTYVTAAGGTSTNWITVNANQTAGVFRTPVIEQTGTEGFTINVEDGGYAWIVGNTRGHWSVDAEL